MRFPFATSFVPFPHLYGSLFQASGCNFPLADFGSILSHGDKYSRSKGQVLYIRVCVCFVVIYPCRIFLHFNWYALLYLLYIQATTGYHTHPCMHSIIAHRQLKRIWYSKLGSTRWAFSREIRGWNWLKMWRTLIIRFKSPNLIQEQIPGESSIRVLGFASASCAVEFR